MLGDASTHSASACTRVHARTCNDFVAKYPWMFEGWCLLHCVSFFFGNVFHVWETWLRSLELPWALAWPVQDWYQ